MNNYRLRRVRSDGIIETVAGTGAYGDPGNGGPALQVPIAPYRVAVAANGTVYFVEYARHRVWRLGCDGMVLPVAGTGVAGFSGDGGGALSARFKNVHDVDVGPDGSLYILDQGNARVRRVTPDGVIGTVAGTGNPYPSHVGDGGPATAADLFNPQGIGVGPDARLYIAEYGYQNQRVRAVAPEGTIYPIAGTGGTGFGGDGGPGLLAQVAPGDVASMPDGGIIVADSYDNRVSYVRWPYPRYKDTAFLVPSADATRVYEFSADGRHLRTKHALTGATLLQLRYDAAGRLASLEDGDGNVTSLERDAAGAPTAIVSPYGQRTALGLDENGYLGAISDPAGDTHAFTYSADGLMQSHTDPRGNTSTFDYDAYGRLALDSGPDGSSLALSRRATANGFVVETRTALGRTSSYGLEYLPTGGRHLVNTFPSGLSASMALAADGTTVTSFPDGMNLSLKSGPDPRFGMLAPLVASRTVSTPGGKTLMQTLARVATLSDPADPLSVTAQTDTLGINGRSFTRSFDRASRTLTLTTPLGRQTGTTLDDAGRPVEVAAGGLLPTSYSYDGQGKLVQTARGERLWSRSYDSLGRLDIVTDPLGRTTQYARDLAGRVVAETRPDGAVVARSYGPTGKMTSVAPPGRPAHLLEYSPVDLLQSYRPPELGSGPMATVTSHDLDRSIAAVLRPGGVRIEYGYDPAGRVASVATAAGTVSRSYDAQTGLLSALGGPAGVGLGFAHDASLLTGASWSGPVAASVVREHDDLLRTASELVNGGHAVSFSYDADGLLVAAGELVLERDAQSGLLRGTTLGSVVSTTGHSGYGELDHQFVTAGGTPVFEVSYTRDLLGRIVEKTETVQGHTSTTIYGYDLAGRLERVTRDGHVAAEYAYDPNGNRLGRTTPLLTELANYDAQDRLFSHGSLTFQYTDNGELLAKTDILTAETTTYGYDGFGNLRTVSLPDGRAIEYAVDGHGRRIVKSVDAGVVQAFVYSDRLRPAAELDAQGSVVSRFVYADRPNVPEYLVKAGRTYRIVHDQLGSVRLVVDAETGAVAQTLEYDEFGRVLSDTSPGFQPFGFGGGLYDPDTGLVRLGARDYDAAVGRWTSKDPIGFRGGDSNLYAYGLGDPSDSSDPRGLTVYECTRWGVGSASAIMHKYQCVVVPGGVTKCFGWGGDPAYDVYDPANCVEVGDQCEDLGYCSEYGEEASCLDECMLQQFYSSPHLQGYNPITNNCYDFADVALEECLEWCQ
ncbi:MAG: hypothetical protein HY744_15000 [Deltaproteobacteria bacterium]|nr:hypothetical protein [Deltaproteobacteria bacterium]